MQKKISKSSFFSLFLIVFIDMIGIGIVLPVLALVFVNTNLLAAGTSTAVRDILLGLLIASYPLAQFFGAPILGALSDKYGRKKILIISLIGTLIGYLLFAVALSIHNMYLLFISRILAGFTGGSLAVAQSAIVDLSDESNKTKNFGIIGMAFGLGLILGPFLGGVFTNTDILSWFSVSTPFYFAALLVMINLVFVLAFFHETLAEKRHRTVSFLSGFEDLAKVFRKSHLLILFITMFLLFFGWSFFTQFFQLYLFEKFQYTPYQIGLYYAYLGIWITFTQGVLLRWLSPKFKPKSVLRFCLIAITLVLILIILMPKAHYLYFISPMLAMVFGFIMPNFSTLVSNSALKTEQGEILGIQQSVLAFSQVIPPIIAGFSITLDIRLPLILAAVFVFISWIVFFFYKEHRAEDITQ